MISAMIAKRIEGKMEPVGTVDLNGSDFEFETSDKRLTRLLEDAKLNGVEVMGSGDGGREDVSVDRLERVPVTEENNGPLVGLLLDHGYHWWEEE